jgi:hypothetical protein
VRGGESGESEENDEISALTNIFHQIGNGSQAVVHSKETGTLIMEWGETRKY